MGLFDTFKGQQYKNELETLQEKYDNLERMLTPEMQDVIKLQELISELEKQKSDILSEMDALNKNINKLYLSIKQFLTNLTHKFALKKKKSFLLMKQFLLRNLDCIHHDMILLMLKNTKKTLIEYEIIKNNI